MERLFNLSSNETKAYDEFVQSLTSKQRKKGIDIIFHIGSGIGIGVTVKCGKHKKDITDYGSW